jgi:hypothetical protein
LARRLAPKSHFGEGDKAVVDMEAEWCIAKMIRRVGDIGPPIDNKQYRHEFATAKKIERMKRPDDGMDLVKGGTLWEELRKIEDPPVPEEFIKSLKPFFVVDHRMRPTASNILQDPWLNT